MCELLVRVIDKINHDDPYLDVQCTKRGDVIVIVPDGHVWGVMEQLDPQYRIVKLPGVPVDDVASLIAPEPETDPQNPNRMLQRRLFRLDLDNMDAPTRAYLSEGKRARRTMHRLNIGRDAILALRVRKPALPDPNVL